jgi:hypothetical protein
MSNTGGCYEATARSETRKRKLARVRRGECGLKSSACLDESIGSGFGHLSEHRLTTSWERELAAQRAWMKASARGLDIFRAPAQVSLGT